MHPSQPNRNQSNNVRNGAISSSMLVLIVLIIVVGAMAWGLVTLSREQTSGVKNGITNNRQATSLVNENVPATPIVSNTAIDGDFTTKKYLWTTHYPAGWKPETLEDSDQRLVVNFSGDTQRIVTVSGTTDLDAWYKAELKKYVGAKLQTLHIDGSTAIQITTPAGFIEIGTPQMHSDPHSFVIFETQGGEMLTNGMVSSFHFLDQKANWLTYTNKAHHYSLLYPPTWTVVTSNDAAAGNVVIKDPSGVHGQIELCYFDSDPQCHNEILWREKPIRISNSAVISEWAMQDHGAAIKDQSIAVSSTEYTYTGENPCTSCTIRAQITFPLAKPWTDLGGINIISGSTNSLEYPNLILQTLEYVNL